jgi:hypothetical protein
MFTKRDKAMKKSDFKIMVLLALFALLIAGCSSTPPSDQVMEEKFRAHEADFKKLASMFKEDANLDSVDETAVYLPSAEPGNYPRAEISSERLDEYRRLLKKTGVKKLFRRTDSIHFIVWRGWNGIDPGNSKAKDYVYAETPRQPIADSLDQRDKLLIDGSAPEVYKKIGDNWYLEYSEVG